MCRQFWSQVTVFQEGAYTMTRCDLCRIHIPEGRTIKNQRNQRCDNNTHMRWQIQDVAIANKCTEANFSLTGEDGAESAEVVEVFKYLRRMLELSYENWPEVLRNIRKERQV